MKEVILIVGGSGFLGKNLLHYNEKNNHLIYSTFNKNKPNSKKNIKINWLHLDLNDTKKYKKDILKIKPTIIIFLSWENIPNFSKLVSQKNLLISKKFFKFIFQNNFCKKIIVSGSCLEYKKKFGLLKENSPLDLKNYFSKAKYNLYLFLEKETKKNKINLIWFRIFYVYGPGQRKKSLIPSIVTNIKQKKKIDIKFPKNKNDFIFIEDVCSAFYKAVNHSRINGIYNLGTSKKISVSYIFRQIKESIGKSYKYNLKGNNFNQSYSADISKIKKDLKWKPRYSFKSGLKKTIM